MRTVGKPTFHQRGYTRQWIQQANEYRQHHPLCLGCWAVGLQRETDCVDHVIPHEGDQALMWDEGNWQPACFWHHNSIKALLERQWRQGKLKAADLHLNSKAAVDLTKKLHRPVVGVDGFYVPGT